LGGTHIKIPAPLDSIPLLHRGGSILPRRDLVRRSASLAWRDPITLVVAVDLTGTTATGSLYLDDGESYSNEQGEFIWRGFTLEPVQSGSKTLALRSRSLVGSSGTGVDAYSPSENGWAKKIADVVVREIVILGLASKPSCVKAAGSSTGLEFDWTDGLAATSTRRRGGKGASVLTIKDAGALVVRDWDLVFEFGGASSCVVTPSIDYDAALQSHECPAGRFLCRNEGHISSCILRSRFNDGICDPECCDGSDETDGKINCPNRCENVGAAYRKTKAEEARKTRVGAAVRKEYIAFGAKEKSKLEAEVEQVKREIVKLGERERNVKGSLEALENAEAGEIERKKESVLYQKIIEMQEAIRALRMQRVNLEGHVADLSGILSDLSVSPFRLCGFETRSLTFLLSTARLQSQLSRHGRPRRVPRVQGMASLERSPRC
jgi:alpha 1,3-glucosidase